MATADVQPTGLVGHMGHNTVAPRCACGGNCAVHLFLAQELGVLSQEVHRWHERENHARDLLARTEHSLREYVALFHMMRKECERLEAQVQELKGMASHAGGLDVSRG
ncbi:hypothetical protein C8T65DRAFT_642219 [Cerioporus squamosus]|nr:hypothetical protein C8T65DRAFT_642219 [Cerioporus squamosus]